MKAAILSKDGFSIKEVEKPACQPGKVLVKTEVCGICEGDVFKYKTALGNSKSEELIGHEGCGVVVEAGAGVEGFKPGDRVADLGNGKYSEYFLSSPDMLAKIPEGLPFEEALGEPVACYVHAAGRFGIKPGDHVAVLGCGFMGIGCLQMAKLEGAGSIVAFDPIAWRREKALAEGADMALDNTLYSDEKLLASLGEFDVVIEAAGVQGVIDMATKMVREHGRIVLVGYHQSSEGLRSIDMKTWNYKALDVVNGHVRLSSEKHAAMVRGLSLIAGGKLDMKSITTVRKFSEISSAFNDIVSRKEGLFKAALKF